MVRRQHADGCIGVRSRLPQDRGRQGRLSFQEGRRPQALRHLAQACVGGPYTGVGRGTERRRNHGTSAGGVPPDRQGRAPNPGEAGPSLQGRNWQGRNAGRVPFLERLGGPFRQAGQVGFDQVVPDLGAEGVSGRARSKSPSTPTCLAKSEAPPRCGRAANGCSPHWPNATASALGRNAALAASASLSSLRISLPSCNASPS